MDLIITDSDSVIITLDKNDTQHYGISRNSISRRAYFDILADVNRLCGFSVGNARTLVELFESKTGGCEMFITKLPPEAEGDGSDKIPCPMRMRKHIYRFASISDLLSSCREMKNCGYAGIAEAYSDKPNGRYFLVTDEETAIATEFLGRYCKPSSISYISEHCKLITGDAISVLGVL